MQTRRNPHEACGGCRESSTRKVPSLIGPVVSALLALLLASPSEAEISSGTLAPNTEWETSFHVIETSKPGPTVFLTGGLHGDEPAGARAAEQIRHWHILRGRLVVLPRANQPGLRDGTRHLPELARAEADLNRNFPKTGAHNESRSIIGRAIWSLVQKLNPDWVVDLHEGYHFHRIQPKSVGSTILASRPGDQHSRPFVTRMLAAVNTTIEDPRKHFTPLSGTADGSLTRAAAERLEANSLILETTTRDQPLSMRTRQHRLMVRALFQDIGILGTEAPTMTLPGGERSLRVALYDGGGVGGSGSRQAAALKEAGRSRVREFVQSGGGFIGICAGAYLAAANYSWALKIGDYKTFCEKREIPGVGPKSMWYRGPSSMVTMELSADGRRILGNRRGLFPVRYHNGPIISAAGIKGLPDFRVLAWFRSEVSRYKSQEGTMVDTPAIICSNFGKGRVLSISPHPESSRNHENLHTLVARGIQWASGK